MSGPGIWAVSRRPGGPSAKSFHRAGSPNHQDDSKENPMVEPAAHPHRATSGGDLMSIQITDDLMESNQTEHRAVRVSAPCQPQQWRVSWLPGRLLGRNEAVTAMTVAETLADGPPTGHVARLLVTAYAAELRLDAGEVLTRLTGPGGAR